MKRVILLILGIFSIIYGIFIFQVGSGTWFWIIWEVIGTFFFLWSLLIQKGFFITHKRIKNLFYVFVSITFAVLVLFCSMIAGDFRSKGEEKLDYIIVLGAQVREGGPSVVLKHRLDAAISYLNDNPTTQCIVSGGQGPQEDIPEALAMKRYLIQKGVNEDKIIMEDKSTSTITNFKFSHEIMKEMGLPDDEVVFVTNGYHVYRAASYAKAEGLTVTHLGTDIIWYTIPMNYLREMLAVLKMWVFD